MIVEFKNQYHLGDNLYHIHYSNYILQENKDITIINYMLPQYIEECNKWIWPEFSERMTNLPLTEEHIKNEKITSTWIEEFNFFHTKWRDNSSTKYFDEFMNMLYEKILKKLNLKHSFLNTMSGKFYHPLLLENSKKYDSYDWLFVNSRPMSAQWHYVPFILDGIIYDLNKSGYNIITTAKSFLHSGTTPCTLDIAPSLFDVASLSINCKNLIGIHTSPYLVSINDHSRYETAITLHKDGLNYTGNINIRNNEEIVNFLKKNVLK